jgi:hypothetical protein
MDTATIVVAMNIISVYQITVLIRFRNLLISKGFNQSRIVILEGKGRVIVRPDTVEDLHETRSKNRRVDLILVKRNSFGKGIKLRSKTI